MSARDFGKIYFTASPDKLPDFLRPTTEKTLLPDKYIAELTHAEKVLAEIFPSLRSDTVKFNFNMFKEFLLDVRFVPDANTQKISSTRAVRQHEILTRDPDNI